MVDPGIATSSMTFLSSYTQYYFPGLVGNIALPSWIDSVDINKITRNKEVVENIKKDKLWWHGGTKARLGLVLRQSCDIAQNNFSNLTIPLLVLQGEKDELAVPSGSKMLFEEVSSTDKEYKEYPDAMHQLLAELQDVKSDVEKKILHWMNQRLSKA